jgi:ABC-type multidrug transport system ATPase subunit
MSGVKVLLSLENVTVNRGMNAVLEDFSLRVNSGEIIGLSGENGCGKSTVIETAAGLLSLRQGSVKHQSDSGLQVSTDSNGMRKRLNPFGLCLQKDSTSGEETILEHLQTAGRLAGYDVEQDELLDLLLSWNLKHRAHDRIATLSGGLSRRVSILASLVPAMVSSEPILILLDEPDDGLDRTSREALVIHLKSLAGTGHGILMASHDEDLIAHSDRTISWQGSKTIESGETPTTNAASKPTIKAQPCNPTTTYRNWISAQDARTKTTIMNGGIAAILVILTTMALDPTGMAGADGWRLWSGLVLLPALVVGLIPGPGQRLLERNAVGAWWAAQTAGRAPDSVSIHVAVLGLVSTWMAVLMIPTGELAETSTIHLAQLLLCGLLLTLMISRVNLALWVVHRWLPRPKQGAQMLLVFMVFPWLLAVEGMTLLAVEGANEEMWTMLIGSFGLLISTYLILHLVRRA